MHTVRVPARQPRAHRHRRDLVDELADLDAEIVLDLAHAPAAHDDLVADNRRCGSGGDERSARSGALCACAGVEQRRAEQADQRAERE